MISFVHVSILAAGGLLMGLPILLHMAMRQRPKPMVFPAVRFLQQREVANRRRFWLRQWLLLASRCFIILLLGLALARPRVASAELQPWLIAGLLTTFLVLSGTALWIAVVHRRGPTVIGSLAAITLGLLSGVAYSGWALSQGEPRLLLGDQQAPVTAVLLFDNSVRMTYGDDDTSHLARARELGNWLLKQLPRESQIGVMDARPRPPHFSVDLGAAKQAVDTLEPTFAPSAWTPRLGQAIELLMTGEHERKELYIFSDLTNATWQSGDSSTRASIRTRSTSIAVQVIDVGTATPRNDAIDRIELSQTTLTPGSTLDLKALIRRQGLGTEVPVRLVLETPGQAPPLVVDGKLQEPTTEVRGNQVMQLEDGQSSWAQFQLAALPLGTHVGYVQIEGRDGIAHDNRQYFAVHVREPWKIDFLSGPEAEASLVTERLAPLEFRAAGRAKFVWNPLALAALDAPLRSEAAVIALFDPPPLTASQWSHLSSYVQKGGGLAVFLGRNATSAQAFNSDVARDLLPAAVGRIWRDEAGIALAPRDYAHPVLSIFRDQRDAIPWDALPIFRHWTTDQVVADARVVLAFSQGQAAILERASGQGRVALITTPFTDSDRADRPAWNLLATGLEAWPTMILLDRLFSHLARTNESPLNFLVGQPAWLPNPNLQAARGSVMTPRGDWLDIAGGQAQWSIPFTESPGIYRLANGETVGTPHALATNLSPDVTRLERISTDEFDDYFGSGAWRLATTQDQLVRTIDQTRIGSEFYPYLLPMLVLVLGLELILSNRFYSNSP